MEKERAMGRVILLTGGTGFIGTHVARLLLDEPDTELVVLVMASDPPEAEHLLARAWWDLPDLGEAIGKNVHAVAGDVRSSRFGLPDNIYRDLVRRVDVVIHTAADLRLDASIEDLRATNVEGVRHVLEFTHEIDAVHGLQRLVHVSTAYVAGGRSGTIDEGPPTDRFGFLNPYEQSKYEGEMLVRAAMAAGQPIAIARPGMVVGDSRTGAITNFNTVYGPLRLYLTEQLRIFPMRPDLHVNIVPVDHVAQAIVRMASDPAAAGSTFHLTAPTESLPTAREMVGAVRAWARKEIGVRLPRPVFAPIPLSTSLRRIRGGAKGRARPLVALLPYFQEHRTFLRGNTDRLVGRYDLDWRDYLPRMLDYATRSGFLHRTGRTVHEQILHRLGHSGRAIAYHDVVGGRHRSLRPAELRRDVLAATASLRKLGVAPGDRIAVVGPNSTRYLTIDVAIGLAGAVCVPLYPTSPPAEIADIVAASGATLLFVGSAPLLGRLSLPSDDVRVVSFCREDVPGSETASAVVTWETFLARGDSADPGTEVPIAPVGPDDIATIRYTSGTTGAPKGVMFDHRAIRWLGETMASLVPWEARNTPARYISFLPMSHVVEGILATYGPGYLPAPVDVWFVDDLGDLPRTLPLVRPVIFFGVPRVYEKLWGRFVGSRAGHRYRTSAPVMRMLGRPFLRRRLLRATGLDRCAQLIVGSAPASEQLLRSFRELGIEVHDAYGLTEAPLVSVNRVGRNRIGTVGEPLPDTEVRVAEDGEVLVRGPQVTRGYADATEQPFRDGWLRTGDLGRLTDDGALAIEGRKKDLLKTSYGKYVRASRIETMLREISGVDEAMVVGEGRPFCSALLWVDEANRDAASRARIDAAMVELNRGLSHPEQVKRWAILTETLSVASGELTPNLKLRRPVVLRRFAREVDALYEDASTRTEFHVGVAPREGAIA
jgi:long-chain acyl-CoA synthetase